MEVKPLRVFIALPLEEKIEEIEEILQDMRRIEGVKWVKKENFHITLRFLGNVEEEKVKDISQCLGKVLPYPPFYLTLQGIGGFPSIHSPRVIWLGCEEGREKVEEIKKRLDEELLKIDFPLEERTFHPHLTLGRVKRKGKRFPLEEKAKKWGGKRIGPIKMEKLVLFQSILQREGPLYIPLNTFYFKDEEVC